MMNFRKRLLQYCTTELKTAGPNNIYIFFSGRGINIFENIELYLNKVIFCRKLYLNKVIFCSHNESLHRSPGDNFNLHLTCIGNCCDNSSGTVNILESYSICQYLNIQLWKNNTNAVIKLIFFQQYLLCRYGHRNKSWRSKETIPFWNE
jgi:hypothetical protein